MSVPGRDLGGAKFCTSGLSFKLSRGRSRPGSRVLGCATDPARPLQHSTIGHFEKPGREGATKRCTPNKTDPDTACHVPLDLARNVQLVHGHRTANPSGRSDVENALALDGPLDLALDTHLSAKDQRAHEAAAGRHERWPVGARRGHQ